MSPVKKSHGVPQAEPDAASEDSGERDVSEEESPVSEGEDDEDAVNEAMKDAPFEVLQKLRSVGEGAKGAWKKAVSRSLKRENKNRPQELSSKKPVPRFRKILETPNTVAKDPRFESLCGELDENRFNSSYEFLFSENLPSERQRLQKLIKKEKDPARWEEHKASLRKIEQQLQRHTVQKERKERERASRQRQKAAVKEGKAPFFPKKAEKRKQELIEKYKELKASGKLDVFLAKRRKKNAAKEHTKLPSRQAPPS